MNKSDLLFYSAYEEFYSMASQSEAFKNFCRDAFGEDFSQDGFSDIEQINKILQYIPKGDNVHILDIGCGNGKMLGYLQQKTGAFIHGFDYSEKAIETAKNLYPVKSEFWEGIIGEIEYPVGQFDVITSMDTMYFAKDMSDFVAQIKRWLKPDGVLFVGYQEGDVMPKTKDAHTNFWRNSLHSVNEKNTAIYCNQPNRQPISQLLRLCICAIFKNHNHKQRINGGKNHMPFSHILYLF